MTSSGQYHSITSSVSKQKRDGGSRLVAETGDAMQTHSGGRITGIESRPSTVTESAVRCQTLATGGARWCQWPSTGLFGRSLITVGGACRVQIKPRCESNELASTTDVDARQSYSDTIS